MNICIIVATHKTYRMPSDSMYLPLQVGAQINNDLGYTKDNTGINISSKNKNYCELTGLYWLWKNKSNDYDYLGLVHYRRYFALKRIGNKKDRIINRTQLEKLLKDNDVILPAPRNYLIETNYSQYIHAHHKQDLDTTKEIIKEKYPNYLRSYEKIMNLTKGHRFNMFIMKRDIFNDYCEWLFNILFELEKRLDISSYNSNDSRVFGFVGERLLDVYLDTNNIEYKDIPYVYLENQNWIIKGFNFLKRKVNHAAS